MQQVVQQAADKPSEHVEAARSLELLAKGLMSSPNTGGTMAVIAAKTPLMNLSQGSVLTRPAAFFPYSVIP
jgi:hypothetical protein